MDKKILIGGAVAGAVGVGAVALWFLTKNVAGGKEVDCSSFDFTQASVGKPVNNRQWDYKNPSPVTGTAGRMWVEDSSYHGVKIYKQMNAGVGGTSYSNSVGAYFVWLGPYTGAMSIPAPSVASSLNDIYAMIDSVCGVTGGQTSGGQTSGGQTTHTSTKGNISFGCPTCQDWLDIL